MRRAAFLAGALLLLLPGLARAQASAIPSAQAARADDGGQHGRALLAEMVQALGGDAWRNRRDWSIVGKAGTFYKGQPNEGVFTFEEYHRVAPFATRVVVITRIGVFVPTDHRDLAELWTTDNGYEISYRGKKDLPKDEVAAFERGRVHSLDELMTTWLKEPGVVVTYDGTSTVERRLADKVTILNTKNDAVTLELDAVTHLPLSRTFDYRDERFHDVDHDREEYDDYHEEQGVMTALTVSRYLNGDLVGQRFYTSVKYNTALDPNLFDPERPLTKKNK